MYTGVDSAVYNSQGSNPVSESCRPRISHHISLMWKLLPILRLYVIWWLRLIRPISLILFRRIPRIAHASPPVKLPPLSFNYLAFNVTQGWNEIINCIVIQSKGTHFSGNSPCPPIWMTMSVLVEENYRCWSFIIISICTATTGRVTSCSMGGIHLFPYQKSVECDFLWM